MLQRFQLGQALGVAAGVGAVFVQPQGDGLQVAAVVLQLRPRGGGHEVFGHQALQLLGAVGGGVGRVFRVLDLAGGRAKLQQYAASQPRNFVGNQGQAPSALVHAALEAGLVVGQRLEQKSAFQRNVQYLLLQFFRGAAARALGRLAHQHVGHGHFLQVGDVFFQVLEGVFDLQRKQAAQASAVLGGGEVGLVKHLDADRVAQVHQGREADQGLAAFADFHQFGEFAERPGGVVLVGEVGGRGRFGFEIGVSEIGVRARVLLRKIGV